MSASLVLDSYSDLGRRGKSEHTVPFTSLSGARWD